MPLFLLLFTLGLAEAADKGAPARYSGGTVAVLPEGCGGKIDTTDESFFSFRGGKRQVNVAWDKVNLLEYGQNVNRRLGLAMAISPLFLLSKARKHFLTIGYADSAGKQQAMVFQVDKGDIRAVLVALEARTGLKVEFQDAEARKAGKG
ncbi:MAG TPA: hypothetical protein VES20_07865 [Bryobacteraceae bacterium]|nr:hypothetical protein [Bryobacteraceae bacterium]